MAGMNENITPSEIAKIKELEKKKFVDDGSKYIFPAGEAAPGANIAPVADSGVPNLQEIESQVNAPIVAAQAMPDDVFVNPNGQPQRGMATSPVAHDSISTQSAAPAINVPDNTNTGNAAIDGYAKESSAIAGDLEKLNQQRALDIEKKMKEDEDHISKIEPKDFFTGKSTWQKVLGGIGMFLGSITPEGAKNVASIIEKEINRDIDTQKTNIKLRQDKDDKQYQRLLQKYGSQEAALLAKKKGAYDLLDLQLKKLELNARNAETRAKLSMGREELDLKRQSLGNELYKTQAKYQQEAAKGAVPGFTGSISDPTSAREFRTQVASAKTAFTEIDNLMDINKKGISSSFSLSDRASAQQSQTLLQGQLREILVGPGAVSEGERALLKDAIANPTNFFSLKGSNDIKLTKLKQAIQRKIEANASAYGLQRNRVEGAREIQ